jgi:hypothetical protein
MSDMKLYNILETFDELESAADKLTPVTEQDINEEANTETCSHCNGTGEHNGKECTHCNGTGVVAVDQVDEAQTKVQTMGNKVRVTTDGDTTEFDDAETAAEFMNAEDEFTTEAAGDTIDYNNFSLPKEPDNDIEMIDYDDIPLPLDVELSEVSPEARIADVNTPSMMTLVRQIQNLFPEDDKNDIWNWVVAANDFGEPLTVEEYTDYRAFGDDGNLKEADFDDELLSGYPGDNDDIEFSTFDSENESHRRRLQRGTPVVLDPELFADPNSNRRGVFVSRSPSGHFGTVVRDMDGKEINVHLSDIKSADLVNNSIYEEFDLNFEEMLKEDITLTQTTNLENPENDTTTVTAVGHEAGEELAAMMANAGLNTGEYASMDAPPIDAGDEMVDTGEPEQMMSMQDMMGVMDAPVQEADVPMATPMTRAQAMASDTTNRELEKVLIKFNDVDILDWLDGGNDAVDEALYAISMEDMPYGTQKARTGDPSEWLYNRYHEEIEQYASDNFGSRVGESRDIEHANTPNERTAGVDAVLQGGGLNKSKRMYKPAGNRYGDNGMGRPIEEHFDEMDVDEPTMKMVQTPDGPKWVAVGDEPGDMDNSMGAGYDDNMIDTPNYDEFDDMDLELDFNESDDDDWDAEIEADRDIFGLDDEDDDYNDTDVDEALSPELQKQKERDQDKIRNDRAWSSRSKGSRLTGKRQGTGKTDGAFRIGEGMSEDSASNEAAEVSFVNEHEGVDNFLNLYKEFKIRTDKK